MPLQQTSGNDTADAYGGGAAAVTNYIEDVFSTWLVTPASSNTTYSVTNGVDVSGKGGMVWMKSRSSAGNNLLYDTVRGASAGSNNALISNSTSGQQTANFDYITGLSNGFTVNFATGGGQLTNNGINYASWTFRKQPKFFDVVTYTGTGSNRTIAHNLGSAPGCIIVKRTDTTADWQVYHNGLTSAAYSIQLNSNAAQASATTVWNSTAPTSTVFSVGTDATVNASGGTYVAYIFASNAGGFGLTGTDNVISCGSFTTNGSGIGTVTLGWEPQWVLFKRSSGTASWEILDTMRGWTVSSGTDATLQPDLSYAETTTELGYPTSTGFSVNEFPSSTYIYIAIRRGPMKVPTDGTKVFLPSAVTDSTTVTTGFPVDMFFDAQRTGNALNTLIIDRLRGSTVELTTSAISAEAAATAGVILDSNTTYKANQFSASAALWAFQRAPSFFDEVCYTGISSATTQTHNLSAVPELVIVKRRDGASGFIWGVYAAPLGATKYLALNLTTAAATSTGLWNNTTPTSSVFSLGTNNDVNLSGATYVAYLFATCAGVSKVGSFTGNGTTQAIACGFTGGARFVLIKRTDSTGDWYVYDTARGMTTLTDPYLLLNSTAAESATLGSVTTTTGGFTVNAAVLAAINTNAASYIFLAIA